MASRGRSAMAGDHGDRSYDSSPDPLALSMNDNTTMSRRKQTPKQPPRSSSPSKQTRRLEASEMIFSSPSKSMVMSTPRAGGASPWRIKVTVHAEPGSDEENIESPSVKRITRTKTTTVPLKDADAQSPIKRPRGRPRKSDVASAANPRRNGTPVKRTARSKSRDAIARAGESSAADIDTDVPPKRRRGRPKKSVLPPTEDDETLVMDQQQTLDVHSARTTPEPVVGSTIASSRQSARFASLEIPDVEARGATPQPSTRQDRSTIANTPLRPDLGKKLRARKGTPHAKKAASVETPSDQDSDNGSDLLTPTSGEEQRAAPALAQDLAPSPAPRNDSLIPSQSSAYLSDENNHAQTVTGDEDAVARVAQIFEVEHQDDHQDITTFAFDEGATRMPDDTTVIDSENFSMISVDSLPSLGALDSPREPEDHQNIPANPEDLQKDKAPTIGSLLRHEYRRSSSSEPCRLNTHAADSLAPSASSSLADESSAQPSQSDPLSGHKTPIIDTEIPAAPPVLMLAPPVLVKSQTPRMGRVVTAGVALQGMLDPSRLTPEQKMLDGNHDGLNDLFRGFSEGTRKELQADLKLGEQLAGKQAQEQPPAPATSSPTKNQSGPARKEGVFRTQRKYRQPRLLTPEDQDHVITPAEPSTLNAEDGNVQYPELNVDEVENAPPSPASSEGAMSWRVDTPPSKVTADTRTASSEEEPELAAKDKAVTQDDYADIWQEEASRSMDSTEPEEVAKEQSPQQQDLFMDDGPSRPARAKLPKTWRRRSAKSFQYSDETESPQKFSPLEAGPPPSDPEALEEDSVNAAGAPVLEDQEMDEDDTGESPFSDGSEDTGMFFQSNMPNIFVKQRPSRYERRKQKAQALSMSSLLDQGESFVPESSPPVATKHSSPSTKTNPFLDTPPRFPTLMSSPKKSSPLRREVRSSDFSSDSPRRFEEESTLPLPQSSPFHTIVDGDSKVSTASDQRQFRMEMEGSTASTIRRVRNEANQYLDAYEQQDRSLNEITEVTEPSRTWHKDRSILRSSPPRLQRRYAQNMRSTRRETVLAEDLQRSGETPVQSRAVQPQEETESEETSDESAHEERTPSSSSAGESVKTTPVEKTETQQPALLDRLVSTVYTRQRPQPPAPHPILSRLHSLPKVEPWTKTHYKALDKLYTTHLKHPALFCPTISPPSPLSNTNGYLLRQFLAAHGNMPYIGAKFTAWGYGMVMTEELVVLSAVFMELMSLEGIEEYERSSGKEIQMGDCVPGRAGDRITGEEVLRRLATVVLGECVRRDEKRGLKIDRSQGLMVEWPRMRGGT